MQKQQVCVHTTVCLLSGGFYLVTVKLRQLKSLLRVLPAASSSLFYSLLHTDFSSIFSYIPPSHPAKRMCDYLGPPKWSRAFLHFKMPMRKHGIEVGTGGILFLLWAYPLGFLELDINSLATFSSCSTLCISEGASGSSSCIERIPQDEITNINGDVIRNFYQRVLRNDLVDFFQLEPLRLWRHFLNHCFLGHS